MQDSDPQRKKTREGKACWFAVCKEITGRAGVRRQTAEFGKVSVPGIFTVRCER